MKINNKISTSRPLGVAKKLIGNTINEADIYSKTVVLTGEKKALQSKNGRWCFFNSLTLLSRIVGNLIVIIPDDIAPQFKVKIENFCNQTWSHGTLQISHEHNPQTLTAADAILNIGSKTNRSLPWTTINSNGWVSRISSGGHSLKDDFDQENALGALMAASLGVTEIFKRIFNVPHKVAPLQKNIEFSLFEQTTKPTWLGPQLADTINIPDTLLIGSGAIGNGIALLFSQLPFNGRVHIIDKQDFNHENLGTCVLLNSESWIQQPKATQVAAWLDANSNLDVTGTKKTIEDFILDPQKSDLTIDLILNGLDDVDARHNSQNLWPATIIDGGINEIGAAVIQHRLDHSKHACLKCWFEPQKVDERLVQSQLTGLNISSLTNIGRLLTEDDITNANEEKRDWLREHKNKGKTLCSIISEAALSNKLGVKTVEGFKPSAPFVATAAASMVVAEAIKALEFPDNPTVSMFQIANLFLGPNESSISINRPATASCQCVVHRKAINQLHSERQTG